MMFIRKSNRIYNRYIVVAAKASCDSRSLFARNTRAIKLHIVGKYIIENKSAAQIDFVRALETKSFLQRIPDVTIAAARFSGKN